MPGAAEQAEAAEQHDVERVLRQYEDEGQHRGHHQRAQQCREDDADRRVVVEADPAGGDLVQRIGRRGEQQQQHRRIVHSAARPDHQERAGKADDHRAPAPDADALVQQRHRQRGHDQRREHHVADQHQQRAADLHAGAPGRQEAPPVTRQEHDQHDNEMPGKARPDDLRHRVMRAEQLHRRVHERKHRDAGAHQQDAAQRIVLATDMAEANRLGAQLAAGWAGVAQRKPRIAVAHSPAALAMKPRSLPGRTRRTPIPI